MRGVGVRDVGVWVVKVSLQGVSLELCAILCVVMYSCSVMSKRSLSWSG